MSGEEVEGKGEEVIGFGLEGVSVGVGEGIEGGLEKGMGEARDLKGCDGAEGIEIALLVVNVEEECVDGGGKVRLESFVKDGTLIVVEFELRMIGGVGERVRGLGGGGGGCGGGGVLEDALKVALLC